jgi:alpha-tubulin suppressor-like RCC1 family protein
MAAILLAIAGSGLTVAGTLTGAVPAMALTKPVVTAGGGHSCALMPDQSVWCWGENGFGQLGNGTATASPVPVQVTGLPAATNVSAGQAPNIFDAQHTCAVDTASQVWCWGANDYGQLGNGTTADSKVPVQVTGGILASQVSAGDQFSCAVTLTHTAKCWGDNNYGELGDGTTKDSPAPVKVKNLTNVVQVATGYFHACARESNGTVWCWGDNAHGQLGDPGLCPNPTGPCTASDVPVIVGMQNVTDIAAGDDDTCAITSTPDSVWCWGLDNAGQLGDNDPTFADAHQPTQVWVISGATQVTTGFDTTCAVASAPSPMAWCWGQNGGQLGNGSFESPRQAIVPVQIFGTGGAGSGPPGGAPVQISAGFRHACLVLNTGPVDCWGSNDGGELGIGSTLPRDIPTPVIGLPSSAGTPNSVVAGSANGCAVTASLGADCWGEWVGDGNPVTNVRLTATPLKGLPAHGAFQVSPGGAGGCVLVSLGGLQTEARCWGSNSEGQLGNHSSTSKDALTPVAVVNPLNVAKPLTGIDLLSGGGNFNCALVHNGGARCWGVNGDGELGDGTNNNSNVPVTVKSLPAKLAQVAAGFGHACALLLDGSVECWGNNQYGQLGNGTTSNSSTPVAVTGLAEPVTQIAVGAESTCALLFTGGVQCWGLGAEGELGNGNSGPGYQSSTPVPVTGLTSGVSIAASGSAACAAQSDGSVWCWGNNLAGQLGQGPGSVGTPSFSATPLMVGGFSSNGTVGISSSFGGSACALNASKQAFCWGDDSSGELGDNDPSLTDTGTPTAVQGL